MRAPETGITARISTVCNDKNDAAAMKSGALPVFATPSMIALMEEAAAFALAPFLDEGETSVGTQISVTHSSPTGHGLEITACAEITEVNGREIIFSVTASDRGGEIGKGIHKRFVVNKEKLLAKANGK